MSFSEMIRNLLTQYPLSKPKAKPAPAADIPAGLTEVGDDDLGPIVPNEPVRPVRTAGNSIGNAVEQSAALAGATTAKPASPSPLAEAGRFAQDVGANVSEQAKQAVLHPIATAKGIAQGLAEGAAAPVTVLSALASQLTGHSAANVLRNLPAVDTAALRQLGYSDELIQHLLDQRELVTQSLQDDLAQENGVVRTQTANGLALYASLLTGGAAGAVLKAAGAVAPVVSIGSGAVGLGTMGGVGAAASGAPAREVGVQTAANAILGGALGGLHVPAETLRMKVASALAKSDIAPYAEAARPREGASAAPVPPMPAATGPQVLIGDTPLTPAQVDRYIFDAVRNQYVEKHSITPEQLDKLIEGTASPDEQSLALMKGISAAHVETLRALRDAVEATPTPSPAPSLARPSLSPEAQDALVARLTAAIEASRPASKARAAEISRVRSQRIGKASGIMSRGGGQEGFVKARAALAGEIAPGEGHPSIATKFTQAEIDHLFDMAMKANVTPFERIRLGTALAKLFDKGEMKPPTPSERALLTEVFGPDLSKAITSSQGHWAQVRSELFGTIAAPRALMSSLDFSAWGRQGALMVTRPEFWNAIIPSIRAFGSERVYQGIMDDIRSRPSYHAMRESGLAIQEHVHEEAFPESVKFVENLPHVKASERAYHGFLRKVRADIFDSVRRDAQRSGAEVGEKFDKALANWVNTFTGRGELGVFEESGKILNQTLFSPRLLAARLQTLNPVFYAKLDPFVARQAIQTLVASGGAAATLLALAAWGGKSAGITVNMDPRSSDFAKIKYKNTRLDLLAGHQQIIKLLAQLWTGQSVSTSTGRVSDLSGKNSKGRNRLDTVATFLEGKLQPVASLVVTALKGKDFYGNPINWKDEAVQRVLPLLVSDIIDAVRLYGPAGALIAVPGAVGVGTQTFTPDSGFSRNGISYKIEGEAANAYNEDLKLAVADAVSAATQAKGFDEMSDEQAQALVEKITRREIDSVKGKWLGANREAMKKALAKKAAGVSDIIVKLAAPDNGVPAGLTLVDEDELGPIISEAPATMQSLTKARGTLREALKFGVDIEQARGEVKRLAAALLKQKRMTAVEAARVGFELRKAKQQQQDDVPPGFEVIREDIPPGLTPIDEDLLGPIVPNHQ